MNDYLEESDLMSVRDLYKKIKEVLSQENTERIFKITDTQLLKLHEQIDRKFEAMLTDNLETDEIFNRATIEKTARKMPVQTSVDIGEALDVHKMNATLAEKRGKKSLRKHIEFRPHSMDLKSLEQIYDNYKTMSNLGFLDQRILSSNLGRILNVPAVVNRPGRPVTIPLSYEDMLNVESWDDSKLVFKKVNM